MYVERRKKVMNKMIKEISQKIKHLRKQQNLTLKDLSEKTGFSVSFLSQVENGSSSLAIVSLKKIADALGVSMNYFFEDHREDNYAIKIEDQKVFKMQGTNSEFIRMSGDFPNRTMETLVVTIAPEENYSQSMTHIGEEFLYVLEGVVIVNIEDNEHILKTGEAIHYPSTLPHYWKNPLNQEAKVLSATSKAIF